MNKLLLIVPVLALFFTPAFAQIQTPITVATDKSFYLEGETILITGEVRDLYSQTPVSVIVLSPEHDPVSISQVVVSSDKKFSTEITADGGLMMTEGIYTITVQYGTENRSATTTFVFGDSMNARPCYDCKYYEINIPSGASNPDAPFFWSENTTGVTSGVITINLGDTVTWNNADTAFHTITSISQSGEENSLFDSGFFETGKSFSYKFDQKGTYPYYCSLHPWMTGEVIVKSDEIPDSSPPSNVDWQSKYFEVLSDFNDVSSTVGELHKENQELKNQVMELEHTVDNLNAVIREQIKVIYDWILSK